MKETSKAMQRRWKQHDSGDFPWRDLFTGNGLDVGSGDDPLTCARPFDLPDGGGDDIRDFFPVGTQFDWIHASQVLEHMLDPAKALYSWIDLVRPGGHIIATVPDWELYEKKTWPSKWNAGHQTGWTLSRDIIPEYFGDRMKVEGSSNLILKLPEWLRQFPVDVIKCDLVDTNYDRSVGPEVDQTFDETKGVEAFIEFVLRKPN